MLSKNIWQPAVNDKEKVMFRFYGQLANEYKPIHLNLTCKGKVFECYGKKGCAIIPAPFSFDDQEKSDEMTKRFIDALQKSGYSFLPLYKFLQMDSGEEEYVPYFVVFPHINTGTIKEEYRSFQDFSEFILDLCKEFKQVPILTNSQNMGLEYIRKGTYFANPFPTTYSERMRRSLHGEIMLQPIPCYENEFNG